MDDKGTAPLLDLLKSGGRHLFPTLEPTWVGESMDLNQILARVGEVGGLGVSPIIAMYVTTDVKQSRNNIILFSQPKLILARRYFLGDRNNRVLSLYQQLYVDLMTHLGADNITATEDAQDMVDFEIKVANATTSSQFRTDKENLYNKMTIQQLMSRYPQFDWLSYIQQNFLQEAINVTEQEDIVIDALAYYDQIFDVVNSTSRRTRRAAQFYTLCNLDLMYAYESRVAIVQKIYYAAETSFMVASLDRTLLNYCLWNFVYPFSSLLDKKAREMKSTFLMAQSGQQRETERWKECVSITDGLFPGEVGRLYVQHHFSPHAKTKVDDMISDLKDVFKEMIQEADWMSDQTRQAALEKVDVMVNQVGYPIVDLNDTYLNAKTEKLNVTKDEYFQNNMNLKRLNLKKARLKLRQPVNREDWIYSAAMVNALYNPLINAIFFPAGFLHKPFFSDQFMGAMNYGGIGAVIGHEITHGFDQSGRGFDKEGNLKEWWQPGDLERFQNRTQCILNQYGNFIEPVLNITVKGRLTLSENIADNGGLKQAYRAYRKLIDRRGKEEPRLPVLDYTPDQLFFINAARAWCSNKTKKMRQMYLYLDNHSPDRFRVIGQMQNSEDFAKAFNCSVGSYMNLEKKCSVW